VQHAVNSGQKFRTPDLWPYFRGVMKARSKFQIQRSEHRTLNKDIGEFMLRNRGALLDHIIETPKVYSCSTFNVGCSMLDVHFF